jgi:peptide chain release factor 2
LPISIAGSPSSGAFFDVDGKAARLAELEHKMADGALWSDQERARQTVTEVKSLKGWLEPYHALRKRVDEGRELNDLLEAESHIDLAMQRQLEAEADAIAGRLESLEMQNMMQGPDDARDALLTIHPGAGGTESQDWAEMLVRMYTRWAERHGFAVEVLDLLPGEEAGIKSAEIEIRGRYAFGLLRAEKGVHRLVRISPFDSQSRRHTSFASVFVYPDVDDEIEIEINDV